MKVVCDNCGAIYKIPEKKLVKEVNKATCRKCGHRILIRREAAPNTSQSSDGEEATMIAHAAQVSGAPAPAAPAMSYPPFGQASEEPTPLPTSPLEHQAAPTEPAPSSYPPASAAAGFAPLPSPAAPAAPPAQPYAAPRPDAEPAAKPAHDPLGDMTVVFLAQGATLVGALLLGVAGQSFLGSFGGLFLAFWGGLTSLFILISGQWGRHKAWTWLSAFVGMFLAAVFAGAVSLWTPVMSFIQNPDVTALMDTLTKHGVTATAPTAPVEEPAAPPVVTPPVEDPAEQPDVADADVEPPPVADADEEPRGLLDVIAEPPPVEEPPAPVEPPASASSSRTPTSTSSSSSRTPSSSSTRTPASSSSSSSRSPSSSSSSSSRSPSSSSTRTPASSSSSSSRTPTSASSSSSSSSRSDLPTSVPTTVIDIQIRNNKNVKSCFVAYKATTGELPQVTLRFTLEPDGHVSSGSLREAAYQSTSLESCLVGSVKMIDFPEFSGNAQTLNYPFRF